jgi:hypothetical protein
MTQGMEMGGQGMFRIPGLVNIQKNHGKSSFLRGKLTMSMAIFDSYVSLPEGTPLLENLYFSVSPSTAWNRLWE